MLLLPIFRIYSVGIYITLNGLMFTSFCSAIKVRNQVLRVPKALKNVYPNVHQRTGRLLPSPKVYRCGEIGKDVVVNFVNKHYPEDDFAAEECNFRLIIQSHDICQIRVDLVDTELLPPSRGECLSQALNVEGSIWSTGLPPLCGINNDQHFYLHLEPWVANTTLVDFKISSVIKGKSYRFGLWITQIDCVSFNVLKAPPGCSQYFLSEKGSIKSFNYEGQRYFNGQNYEICIRPGRGVCGIRYDSSPGDFRIKKSINGPKEMLLRSGAGTSVCGTDFVFIPDGRDTISALREKRLLFRRRRPPSVRTPPPPVAVTKRKFEVPSSHDRFCGGNLSPVGGETINKPVFARVRSNLISIYFKTSPLQEFNGKIELLNLTTGFLIKYTQLRNCEDEDEAEMVVPPPIASQMHAMQMPLPVSKHPELTTFDTLGSASTFSKAQGGKDDSLEKGDIGEEDSIWEYLEEGGAENDEDVYDYFD